MRAIIKRGHIIHVAPIRLVHETGMGRIACEWRDAFVRRGFQFTHVGLDEVAMGMHVSFWQRRAKNWIRKQRWNLNDPLWLVHEAGGGVFTSDRWRTCIFSHGIERRGADLQKGAVRNRPLTWRSFLAQPLWRLQQRSTDIGMRRAWRILVSNTDDARFALDYYGRSAKTVRVFRNGVDLVATRACDLKNNRVTILFVASWLERKGIKLLVQAAERLHDEGACPRWILAGGGVAVSKIIELFPVRVRNNITIIERFTKEQEGAIFKSADIFVLPSFFEGQSLALLQAMAHGLCCITTNCCGQKDLLKHRSNGLLFQPGDVDGFLSCLRFSLVDHSARSKIGQAAADSVVDRAWTKVGDELVGWLEREIGADDGLSK